MVYLDGVSLGAATLGSPRQDVVRHFGRSDYLNSGWSLNLPALHLTSGSHIVTAIASGPSGAAELPGSRTVSVTADTYRGK